MNSGHIYPEHIQGSHKPVHECIWCGIHWARALFALLRLKFARLKFDQIHVFGDDKKSLAATDTGSSCGLQTAQIISHRCEKILPNHDLLHGSQKGVMTRMEIHERPLLHELVILLYA